MNEKRKELLSQLYAMEASQDYALITPEAAAVKLLPYRKSKTENFIAIVVDNKNNFLGKKVISKGTVDQSPVFPREIFRYAIQKQASGVILAHNHPGGDPAPSASDIEMTREIKKSGAMLGIRVLDHIIIARSGHYSFQENGRL